MRYIDTHTHVVSDDPVKYPLAPINDAQSDWSKERPTSAADMVKAMDDAGVEKGIVVHASTAYGFDNSFCADSVEEEPERLFGVGSINFLSENNLKDLSYLIDDRKFIGCRIYMAGDSNPDQPTWALDDPRTFPAWGFAEERGFPVVISMQQSAIPEVKSVTKHFPNVKIVIDNACRPNLDGGPPYAKADEVFSLSDYENVSFKVMSGAFQRAAKSPGGGSSLMRALFDRFGMDRVAWGSNFPGTEGTMAELIEFATKHLDQLNDAERQSYFYGAAVKMYPTLAD